MQDADVVAQLDRMDMALNSATVMLSTLLITEELCGVSTSSDDDGDITSVSSLQDEAAHPDDSERVDDDGHD